MKPLRIDGIPVHAILVHFPVAAWSAASLLALAAAFGHGGYADAALACNVVGLVTGLASIGAGALEYAALPGDDDVREQATRHMMLAGSAWTLYLGMLALQVADAHALAAAMGIVAGAALVAAGHAGGRLVFHYRIPRDG